LANQTIALLPTAQRGATAAVIIISDRNQTSVSIVYNTNIYIYRLSDADMASTNASSIIIRCTYLTPIITFGINQDELVSASIQQSIGVNTSYCPNDNGAFYQNVSDYASLNSMFIVASLGCIRKFVINFVDIKFAYISSGNIDNYIDNDDNTNNYRNHRANIDRCFIIMHHETVTLDYPCLPASQSAIVLVDVSRPVEFSVTSVEKENYVS
jgi:hypothetical protein